MAKKSDQPEQEKSELTSFHFDVGNSSTGPIGLCARVKARTREEALEVLKAELPEELRAHSDNPEEGIEYINVYINDGAITVADIDDEESVAEDEDEGIADG